MFLSIAFVVFSASNVFGQYRVTGTVPDASTLEPLPGVNIQVKGTTQGTSTTSDGTYELQVPAQTDTLIFSYVGYASRYVAVNNRSNIDVQLQPQAIVGEDLVVVGYGTQERQDVTGSISSVDADEMKKFSISDPSELLQGRVAGVQVISDGQPGAIPDVKIRGIGTFGDHQPLYVIDGVPVGTSVRDFNPDDIESVQILKDASAAAIYGSRAANGVVIITNKKRIDEYAPSGSLQWILRC